VPRNPARRAPGLLRLSILGLLIAAVPAHAGGQKREPERGHRVLPPFGAKVVTEHVPVLPIPGIWRAPAVRTEPKPKVVAKRMGFRAPDEKPVTKPAPKPVKKPAPPVEPAIAPSVTRPADIHLRAGRAKFGSADYEGAILQFRLSEDKTAALVGTALAQAAAGRDEPAARSFRKAVRREPALVRRDIDFAGGFRDRAEYGKVLAALEIRAAAVPGNADAKFVLAVVRYYAGDRRAQGTFAWLARVTPADRVADLFLEGARRRFPPEKKKTQKKPSSAGRREGAKK